MALTETAIRNAKPREKAYKLADGGGLFLQVMPAGGKLWRLKFRVAGKEKLLALGKYPVIGLKEARKGRDAAKQLHASGVDPAQERKLEKIAAKVNAATSFGSVAEDFIAVKLVANERAAATIDKARWFLSLLQPALGARAIQDIEPAELLLVLKKLEKKGHRETAVRTRAFASRVFRYGVATARCKADPAALLTDALSTPQVKHHAAILDESKLGEFLRTVRGYNGSPVVSIAMQLLPHIFLRPGEMRQGRWEEVNWDDATWIIPASRMKLRRPHALPLSQQALSLLRQLQEETGGFELMFPGRSSHLRPMSENTLNATYRRLGYGAEEVTAHGFRATASTLLNESNKWHADAIERALAHGHSDAVRGAYARGQHFPERVLMAQWWSDHLDMLRDGAQIVPFRPTRARVKRGR